MIGSAALAVSSVTSFADGLLGERYVSLTLATDSEIKELAAAIGYNTKLKDGLDLYLEIGESDDGEVIAGLIDFRFYTDLGDEENWKVYFAPIIGYASIDVNRWRTEKEFLYGVGVGSDVELDEKSNINLSLSMLETQNYGDLGLNASIEYNYWITSSFNAGLGVSYNSEVKDEAFSLVGRWRF